MELILKIVERERERELMLHLQPIYSYIMLYSLVCIGLGYNNGCSNGCLFEQVLAHAVIMMDILRVNLYFRYCTKKYRKK